MAEIQRTKIKSLYGDLKGLLNEIPEFHKAYWVQSNIVLTFNQVLDDLSKISNTDYSIYQVPMSEMDTERRAFEITRVRTQISRVVSRLEEEHNFKSNGSESSPNMVINQNQSQSQSISLILDIQEKILSEIPKHKEGSKERTFLEKVKLALPNIKTATDIFAVILKIGADVGLQVSDIHKLLHF